MAWKSCVLCLSVVAAAAGCNDDPEFSCDDPKYDNGTCDLDVTCGAPDIDCFTLFTTGEEAKAWWDAQTDFVAIKGSALPVTDSRYAATQALIDEGWEGYKAAHTVGKLADHKPFLVLIDNPAVNAFVLSPPPERQPGFAVMVNTGLVDLTDAQASKAWKIGVMMHEFEHAVGLHGKPEIKAGLTRFYVTDATSEKLGYQQMNDAGVQALFDSWGKYAQFVGFWSDMELGVMPLSPAVTPTQEHWNTFGLMGAYFRSTVVARAQQVNTAACNNAANAFLALRTEVMATLSPLDDGLTPSGTYAMSATNALVAVRDNCFSAATQVGTLITGLAGASMLPEATIRMEMPDDLEMQLDTRTIINAWASGSLFARQRMREIQAQFETMYGVPWSRLRYMSSEEAADDSSARTMLALGLEPDGAAQIVLHFIAVAGAPAVCDPLLASNSPLPYSENLPDDHHGGCWRVGHQRQIAADAMNMAKVRYEPILDAQPLRAGLVPESDTGASN